MNKNLKHSFRPIHGWLILDKPQGISSAKAVARARHCFNAKKAGHAGTLDPLATGLLPIAFGEATKTIPFLTDQTKSYEWEMTFGSQTDTGDSQGKVVAQSSNRPSAAELKAVLPEFTGTIWQTPPQFSALKIKGEAAYKKARRGETFSLPPRQRTIDKLELLALDEKKAKFFTQCQKGVYIRALAQDIAQKLNTCAHITSLRRTHKGPFSQKDALTLAKIEEIVHSDDEHVHQRLLALLLPLECVLEGLPKILIEAQQAQSLRQGQSIILYEPLQTLKHFYPCLAFERNRLVALTELQDKTLKPKKIFNL